MSWRTTLSQRGRHLVRRVRHRLHAGAANLYVAQQQRVWQGSKGLGHASLEIGARAALGTLAVFVPVREAMGWHRLQRARAGAAEPGAPAYPAYPAVPGPWRWGAIDRGPLTVPDLLSARLHTDCLAEALNALRQRGPLTERTYRRAMARLAKDETGDVVVRAGTPFVEEASAWGERCQNLLAEELAWWTVTRADWRRAATVRAMLTTPTGFMRGLRGRVNRTFSVRLLPMSRLIDLALLGEPSWVSDRERALALVDAGTWPELLQDGGGEELELALQKAPCAAGVMQALRPDDIGTLLQSPSSVVRTWVMTSLEAAQASSFRAGLAASRWGPGGRRPGVRWAST